MDRFIRINKENKRRYKQVFYNATLKTKFYDQQNKFLMSATMKNKISYDCNNEKQNHSIKSTNTSGLFFFLGKKSNPFLFFGFFLYFLS